MCHDEKVENETVHTFRGLDWSVVDVIVMEMTVPAGTLKFVGKSTCGDTGDGAKTPVVLGVVVAPDGAPDAGVVAPDGAPDDGVVVVLPREDGICELNCGEVVPFG